MGLASESAGIAMPPTPSKKELTECVDYIVEALKVVEGTNSARNWLFANYGADPSLLKQDAQDLFAKLEDLDTATLADADQTNNLKSKIRKIQTKNAKAYSSVAVLVTGTLHLGVNTA